MQNKPEAGKLLPGTGRIPGLTRKDRSDTWTPGTAARNRDPDIIRIHNDGSGVQGIMCGKTYGPFRHHFPPDDPRKVI